MHPNLSLHHFSSLYENSVEAVAGIGGMNTITMGVLTFYLLSSLSLKVGKKKEVYNVVIKEPNLKKGQAQNSNTDV